jgi:hypothetical protein
MPWLINKSRWVSMPEESRSLIKRVLSDKNERGCAIPTFSIHEQLAFIIRHYESIAMFSWSSSKLSRYKLSYVLTLPHNSVCTATNPRSTHTHAPFRTYTFHYHDYVPSYLICCTCTFCPVHVYILYVAQSHIGCLIAQSHIGSRTFTSGSWTFTFKILHIYIQDLAHLYWYS